MIREFEHAFGPLPRVPGDVTALLAVIVNQLRPGAPSSRAATAPGR